MMTQGRAGWNQHTSPRFAAQILVAQEAERKRICREMHDDLAQRIALLEFDIERMKRKFYSQPQVLPELESLSGSVAMLAGDVHRICERLHPVVLDNLGLVRGIEFLCREHHRTSGMRTSFLHGLIPDQLASDVSLCLYRVVQETLHNAAKYSRAASTTVTLRPCAGGIRAVVRDDGQGFCVKDAKRCGLGLVFLAERVKLLGGRCAIRSVPGKGTRISVWVPAAGNSGAVRPSHTTALPVAAA